MKHGYHNTSDLVDVVAILDDLEFKCSKFVRCFLRKKFVMQVLEHIVITPQVLITPQRPSLVFHELILEFPW